MVVVEEEVEEEEEVEDDDDDDDDDNEEDDDDDDEEEAAAAESGGRIGIFLCFFLSPLPLFSISVNSAFPFVSVYALSTSGITTVPHNSGRGED